MREVRGRARGQAKTMIRRKQIKISKHFSLSFNITVLLVACK